MSRLEVAKRLSVLHYSVSYISVIITVCKFNINIPILFTEKKKKTKKKKKKKKTTKKHLTIGV